MKRLFCGFIALLMVLSVCGCAALGETREQQAFGQALDGLVEALDSRDADKLCQMFSPAVRAQDEDLEAQIQKLLALYTGPVEEVGWDGLLGIGNYKHQGNISVNAYKVFPLRTQDAYYWCYLDLMIQNTFDEAQVGITQLEFYTAEDFCVLLYEEGKIAEGIGLQVHGEKSLEEQVRCIGGWPYKYEAAGDPLELDGVEAFFEQSNSFTQFKEQFGEAAARHIYTYYPLQSEEGEPRYLKLGIDWDGDTIYGAFVEDDFQYLKTVFREEPEDIKDLFWRIFT